MSALANLLMEERYMLVLSRKLMEKIYIGDDIVITVVRLERDKVRLGIEAPRDVNIVRAEISDSPPGRRPRD